MGPCRDKYLPFPEETPPESMQQMGQNVPRDNQSQSRPGSLNLTTSRHFGTIARRKYPAHIREGSPALANQKTTAVERYRRPRGQHPRPRRDIDEKTVEQLPEYLEFHESTHSYVQLQIPGPGCCS